MDVQNIHDRVAAVGAAVSGVGASVAWLTTFNEIVQAVAGIVAILSGLATGIYFVMKIIRLHRLKGTDSND